MREIPATEFKARCLELMDRVAERQESYVITKRGKPVAKLVPPDPAPKESIFGCLRQYGEIVGDIVSPALPPEAWKTVEKWDRLNFPDVVLTEKRPARRPKSRRGKR